MGDKQTLSLPKPRYRLTEKAWFQHVTVVREDIEGNIEALDWDDVLMNEGTTIEFPGIPAHYMQPINDAARKQVEQYKPQKVEPMDEFSIISEKPAVQVGQT